MRRALVGIVVVAVVATACSGSHRAASARRTIGQTVAVQLAALVNPFMGTGVGGKSVGEIHAFPGADLPFGMMQWGPDTAPQRAAGGGYLAGSTALTGFSLTHLSGPGCPVFGDVPVLPAVGSLPAAPERALASFAAANQVAKPGSYAVTLTQPHVRVELGVTTHTGLARFTFPRATEANLLLKVADSANGAQGAQARIVGDREVEGSVVSGHFCDTPGTYRLSFDARFDRPFTHVTAWRDARLIPGARSVDGQHSGIALTFDTTDGKPVLMKVGISFVSVGNAVANLETENRGWDLAAVTAAATNRWNALLGRIAIDGGTPSEQRTFASALYHSLLHPNVFSDDNGQYLGFDNRVHTTKDRVQYANFSGWDVYRSQIPLVALLAPHEASDMMQSLVNDAAQGGFLPKWPLANFETAEMNGDSADAIIAGVYAFGAHGFDARAALRAMVKGATTVGAGMGWDVARQDLDEYMSRGWVQGDRRDRTSLDYTIGGSETLEYAIDDFAIAQLASALGDAATAATFRARAENWRHLVDPATRYLAARRADGSFPPGPAFQESPLPGIGQDGWEEGNAIQYSWSVPQDLSGLFAAMGGNRAVVQRLDAFFARLDTSRKQPYDWAGNEPALGIPWEYDAAGAPSRTQDVVRRIASLYSDTPNGEPGNDDLGALASWYVWAAIGLYPETPGRATLFMSTPLFSHVAITLPDGRQLVLDAPGTSAQDRYVQSVSATGISSPPHACGSSPVWQCAWLPASVLTTGAHLAFTLAAQPSPTWATSPAAAPPSGP